MRKELERTPKLTARSGVMRPALRYFGGKWSLAPWIIGQMPPHRVYVEPFGGGAGVLLRKPRSTVEVYNDLDGEIVDIFRAMQDPVKCAQLMRRLRRTPYARREFERAFQRTCSPMVRVQRAIIRSYMSFHHTALFDPRKCSFSNTKHRNGGGNSAQQWSTYPRHLVRICQRLRGVIIENRDALDVIQAQDTPTTLFYVDPPYLHSTRGDGGYRCELNEQQHVNLLRCLCDIQGRAMIAGYPSDLYDDMLKGWQRLQRPARAAGSRKARMEVLWISPVKDVQ